MYSNYHRHTYYSNIVVPDVVVSNEDYAIRAQELGHKLLSGVEHGWAGHYIEPFELAKKYDLKFLFGTEAYIVKDRLEKDNTNSHIILLAKNENGRRNINRILSEANQTGFYYRARIDMGLLLSLPKNDVWVTSACIGGLWKYEDAENLLLKVNEHFGENFFLEVQDHNTLSQRALNYRILEFANKNKIKTIFGCDSHYIFPEQFKDRDDFLLSKHITYEDEVGWYIDYPSDEEVVKRFDKQGILTLSQVKEAMDNSNILLDVEEYNSPVFEQKLKLPTLYPEFTQEQKDQMISDLIWNQWEKEKDNVPVSSHKKYEKEIKKELDIVIETKMADYFLLDYQIIKHGKEIGGSITMTGRGSAPSFYLSKLLGFTTIDRIDASVKLFPERFITKERILEAGSLPDVDFNLGNPEVFAQAQTDVLGENHSYPMLAYGTLHPKAAWKLYARAKNVDFETANMVSGQIDKYEMDLKHGDDEDKESLNVLDYIDEDYRQMYSESEKYLGIVSDSKIHPCAHLLYNGNIKEEIGLIKIKTHLCCVMDGLWAENYKFLKNDLLKVSVVDLIYKVYERIGITPHPLPELIKLCHKNQKVWNIYKNAWTIGINQVEQMSTSGRVAKYSPQNISELSAFVAAVRPGFQSNYKQFEARESFSYNVKSLDKLIQTDEFPQSYLLYQEQAMQVMAYAGIPISQTYEVIKNIAKKRVEKVLKYKDQFVKGMTKKVIQTENKTEDEAETVAKMTWKIIEDSSRYSFNASHSYSVAGDSLYGAYLKSHYPIEFYEVILKLLEADGDKDRLNRAKDEAVKAFKINFPPYRFGQDNRKIVAKSETNEIMSSLASIKGFGNAIGENMFELSQKEYPNFVDFLISAEEQGFLSSKFDDLIKVNYFEKFGRNKKLQTIFDEFTKGKNRYSKTHSDKTKEKRIVELKKLWEETSDERIPFWQQLGFENEILGYIQATYPEIDRRFLYILELKEKDDWCPRTQIYCLKNGHQTSLKIQKKTFNKQNFRGGDIIYASDLESKFTSKKVNGDWIHSTTEKEWWINSYRIVDEEEFNKLLT